MKTFKFQLSTTHLSPPSKFITPTMSLLYITEEVVENFSGSGMDLLFEVLESYQENDAESEEILAQIFTELLITFEENKLDVNDIKSFHSGN